MSALIAEGTNSISRLVETVSRLANSNLVTITRAGILERLAEVDALLDIMAEYDETELMIEREHLVWLLHE